MKLPLGIGIFALVIGAALMVTGQSMCRTQCWVDSVWKMLLPERLAFLAGGLSWAFVGAAVIGWTLLSAGAAEGDRDQQ